MSHTVPQLRPSDYLPAGSISTKPLDSNSIQNILSSSIQRAKEKISLMENRLDRPDNGVKINQKEERSGSAAKEGNSTGAIANAMKILQSRIGELEKTIEGLQREKTMLLRELDNASSEKKIILSSLEQTTRKSVTAEQTLKQLKAENKQLTLNGEKLCSTNIELDNRIKELEISLKHSERTRRDPPSVSSPSTPPLPPQGKMHQSEMFYRAKLKELEDFERNLIETQRKLGEREKKLQEATQEEVRMSKQSAEISNRLLSELEAKNQELHKHLQLAKEQILQLQTQKQLQHLAPKEEILEEYTEKINELEEELQELRQTTKNKRKVNKNEQIMDRLKNDNSALTEKCDLLADRLSKAEERIKREQKESRQHRNKFWELKSVLNEIVQKVSKLPNALTSQLRYLIIRANKVESATSVRQSAGWPETPKKQRSDSIASSKSKKKSLHKLKTSRNSNASNSACKSRRSDSIESSSKKYKGAVSTSRKTVVNQDGARASLLTKQIEQLRRKYKVLVKSMNSNEDEETRNQLNQMVFQLREKEDQLAGLAKLK